MVEAAADELADIIGLSEAMPILEEELDFLRAERRKLQAEVVRLELAAEMTSYESLK